MYCIDAFRQKGKGGIIADRPMFRQQKTRRGATQRLPFAACPSPDEAPMFAKDLRIAGYDDELARAIEAERQRQEDHVELLASENSASPRVLEAQGSVHP